MKRLFFVPVFAASVACIEPARAPVNAGPGSPLVQPGQSPPPTTTDATMPPSLPPPTQPAAAMQGNPTYRTGQSFIIVGAALVAVGVVFAVLGAVLTCKVGSTDCPTQSDVDKQKSIDDAFVGIGVASIIGGVVVLGIGIPLSIVGANQAKRDLGYALLIDHRGFGFRF